MRIGSSPKMHHQKNPGLDRHTRISSFWDNLFFCFFWCVWGIPPILSANNSIYTASASWPEWCFSSQAHHIVQQYPTDLSLDTSLRSQAKGLMCFSTRRAFLVLGCFMEMYSVQILSACSLHSGEWFVKEGKRTGVAGQQTRTSERVNQLLMRFTGNYEA